jgi:bile acid:Na+ symporter, BASS family
LAALAMILLLKPVSTVAIGLAILLSSPAAPMMIAKIPKKGGSLAYVSSLHLSLALLALFTVPLTLYVLSKALGFYIEVEVLAVARVVGMTILVPVGLGSLIRFFFPHAAGTIGPVFAKFGGIAMLVLTIFIAAITYRLLLKMDPWSYVVMAMVVMISLAIGHFFGPHDEQERTTLAMESAARHPGLAMTIAALNFNRQQALAALVPYLVVFMVVTTIYLQWRKRCPAE